MFSLDMRKNPSMVITKSNLFIGEILNNEVKAGKNKISTAPFLNLGKQNSWFGMKRVLGVY